VQRFVEKTLAGSLSPLIAYFAKARNLTPDERAQLENLIAGFEEEKAPASEEPER
jgi:predicted transcriptional regulator